MILMHIAPWRFLLKMDTFGDARKERFEWESSIWADSASDFHHYYCGGL